MVGKRIKHNEFYATIYISLLLAQVVLSKGSTPIPMHKSEVDSWFDAIIKPVNERGDTLDPKLVTAETKPTVIKVRQGGGGDFETITKAIKSVPSGNTKRVIISIGPGSYTEKILIEEDKPFITFLGDAKNMPELTFNGNAHEYGTVESATLMALASYFVGVNLKIVNTSPRPDGKIVGAQAVALRISGDRSAFYNCKVIGFQDTLCDDKGNHFFKDCYIRGTVDFIFGSGKSLYLGSEIYVDGDMGITVITAQARQSSSEDNGFAFVHGRIIGTAKDSFLGRAWKSSPRVVYAYTEMSSVINPEGWSHGEHPEKTKNAFYGEYKCSGKGASPSKREKNAKQLSDEEAAPFLVLDYIEATKWLLPPPKD